MSSTNHREERLDGLFLEYRAACGDPEGGANFVPLLWQRIEARRSPVLQWVTMGRRALVGALALCLMLGVVMGTALSNSQFYQSTYVEVLDGNEVPEDLAALQVVTFDIGGGAGERR